MLVMVKLIDLLWQLVMKEYKKVEINNIIIRTHQKIEQKAAKYIPNDIIFCEKWHSEMIHNSIFQVALS